MRRRARRRSGANGRRGTSLAGEGAGSGFQTACERPSMRSGVPGYIAGVFCVHPIPRIGVPHAAIPDLAEDALVSLVEVLDDALLVGSERTGAVPHSGDLDGVRRAVLGAGLDRAQDALPDTLVRGLPDSL